ncbi:MAG: nitroreductase [Bermanella sp.]|jgi:nitroreductase
MNLAIKKLIEERTSVGKYQAHIMPKVEVEELVRLASFSPSAYNLQNWKFIAVQSDEGKQRLQSAAYGQPQVTQASVTFIVCGQTQAHLTLAETLTLSVDQQVIPQNVADSWVEAVKQSHEHDPSLQRDEAFRSASLAAMSLMYAAKGMGYGSGAMGGFDAQQVIEKFGLSPNDIPVMLVTVGKAADGNWQQKIRKATTDVLQFA